MQAPLASKYINLLPNIHADQLHLKINTPENSGQSYVSFYMGDSWPFSDLDAKLSACQTLHISLGNKVHVNVSFSPMKQSCAHLSGSKPH